MDVNTAIYNYFNYIYYIQGMEENIDIEPQKVTVNSSELLKKFKSREDRYNFLREMSNIFFNILDLYLPKEVGFDSYYFLQVLTGTKNVKINIYNVQLLPIGHHSDYDLKYFRKDHTLTKDFLINIIQNNQIYQSYLPDNINLKSISRDYILSVSVFITFQIIAYLTPNIYSNLYELYKTKSQQNEYKKWNDYKIDILPNIKHKIDEFVPCQR